MKNNHLIVVATFLLTAILPANAQMKASRSSALLGAKNLMLTTTTGTTYYYLVSSNDTPMLHFTTDSVRIGNDKFAKARIQAMRFHALPRLYMDEDSTTFYRYATLDHGLIALRRTMVQEEWNSLVLPIDLTGTQVREAFGEDAQLAMVRGISEEDETAIEFESVDLNTDERALRANYHYLIRPTKEPDVTASSSLSGFSSSRVKGPIYLFPNVSLKTNQSARYQTLTSTSGNTQVRFRGTYVTLDGSTSTNKLLDAGSYTMNDESHQFSLNEEATSLQAFRSWILDLSAEPKPLKFYVDGVELTDGIKDTPYTGGKTTENTIYDLSGRRVTSPTLKGIYIINGRKVAVK